MYGVDMKRIVCILLTFAMAFGLFASNGQRLVPIEDESYEMIDSLFISIGMAVPSTSRPWSEDEFAMNLRRINEEQLSPSEAKVFRNLSETYCSHNEPMFRTSLDANLEAYIHTNKEYKTSDDWLLYGFDRRKPFLNVSLGLSPTSIIFAEIDATFGTTKFSTAVNETTGRQQWFEQTFTTNLFMFDSKNNGSPDGNIPYRGYLSFGGDNWNLQLGREKLSWGVGESGNLIIGSQLQYHNMLRLTSYNEKMKLTFLASFFPHPDEIYGKNSEGHTKGDSYNQTTPTVPGIKVFLGHMLELFMFEGRLSFTISENIMYQSDEGNLDLRNFSPMMIFHNLYNPGIMNSILGIEAIWAPAKGFNAYIQFALDDLALSVESTNKPNAIGLIGGVKWSSFGDSGLFKATLEGAYTSPYMYLRSKKAASSQTEPSDSLDFIVAIRRWFGSDGDSVVYDREYLGYRYGNDAIVALLSASYDNMKGLKANASIFFMAHGEKNKDSLWKMGGDLEPGGNMSPFGKTEYSLAAGLGAQYSFSSNTTASIQMAVLNRTMKGTDIQIVVSATQHVL